MVLPDTRQLVEEVTRLVYFRLQGMQNQIVLGVSNRHVHLSREDLATLFGLDALTVYRKVRQPGEFAAEQFVKVHGPRTTFDKVRVMGPCRPKSQVELSRTDCVQLGIDAPSPSRDTSTRPGRSRSRVREAARYASSTAPSSPPVTSTWARSTRRSSAWPTRTS
jgi:propanediol utilization protein